MIVNTIRKINSAIAKQRDRAEFDLVMFCCKFLDADSTLPHHQQITHYKHGLEKIKQLAAKANSYWYRRWFTYGVRCVFNKPRAAEDAREIALIRQCLSAQPPRLYFIDKTQDYIFEYRCLIAEIRWHARQCYQQKRHRFAWGKNAKGL